MYTKELHTQGRESNMTQVIFSRTKYRYRKMSPIKFGRGGPVHHDLELSSCETVKDQKYLYMQLNQRHVLSSDKFFHPTYIFHEKNHKSKIFSMRKLIFFQNLSRNHLAVNAWKPLKFTEYMIWSMTNVTYHLGIFNNNLFIVYWWETIWKRLLNSTDWSEKNIGQVCVPENV